MTTVAEVVVDVHRLTKLRMCGAGDLPVVDTFRRAHWTSVGRTAPQRSVTSLSLFYPKHLIRRLRRYRRFVRVRVVDEPGNHSASGRDLLADRAWRSRVTGSWPVAHGLGGGAADGLACFSRVRPSQNVAQSTLIIRTKLLRCCTSTVWCYTV